MSRFYALALVAALAAPVHAQTITVNTLQGDDDGSCDALDTATGADCSVLEAVALANGRAGADRIEFSVSGTISLVAGLEVTDQVVIDGAAGPNQPGDVVLDGANAVTGSGPSAATVLVTGAGTAGSSGGGTGSEIRGLTVVAPTGTAAVSVRDQAASVRVAGNWIGTDPSGSDRGQGAIGIATTGSGQTAIEDNTVGFSTVGIVVDGSPGTTVVGNFVGTNGRGRDLGNALDGVRVSADAVSVGGTGNRDGNVIRFNGRDGVRVVSPAQGVRILGNAISDNGGLGIDLGGDGVTANDATDGDAGANGLQNFPVLDAASRSNGATVEATLTSEPSTTYRVEVFSSSAADPSGFGEGAVFLGAATLTTGSAGVGTARLDVTGVSRGAVITATATRLNASRQPVETSEFSRAVTVSPRVSFEAASLGAVEGDTVDVVLRLSEPAPAAGLSVDVALASGDPADLDGFATRTVTFARNATTATLRVPVTDDGEGEPLESFTLRLQDPVGLAVLDPRTLVLEVRASGIGVGFDPRAATVPENAGVYRATIRVGGPVSAAGTVDVVLAQGDPADVGGFRSRTVSVPRGGARTITVDIPITNDVAPEPDEVVVFALRNATGNGQAGFSLRDSTLTLTIGNDDGTASTVTVAPLDENDDGRDDGGPRTFASPVGGLTAGDVARAAGTSVVYALGPDGAFVALDPTAVVTAGQAIALDAAPGTVLTLTGSAAIGAVQYAGVAVGGRVLVAIGNPRDRALDLGAVTVTNGTLADVVSVFDPETDAFRPVSLSGLDADLDEFALGPFEVAVLQVRPRSGASAVAVVVPVTGSEASRGTLPITDAGFQTTPDEETVVVRLRGALATAGDSFVLRFGDGRAGLDLLDGVDVASPFGVSLAGVLDGTPFSVVALEDLVAGPGATVPLDVRLPSRGSYELEVVSAPSTVGNRPVQIEVLDDGVATSIAEGTPFALAGLGAVTDLALRVTLGTAVDRDDEALATPALAVYPNPSSGAATVALEVAEAGPVRVAVYDALGREVAVLEDGPLAVGQARFVVEGLAPGAYVVRAEGEGLGLVRSLSVVR